MLSSITCGFRSAISSIWFDVNCIETPPRLSTLTRGGFRGGVRGVRPPKIRKAYVIQR